jgi:DNA-directed RNA polymerase subunit K
MEKEKEFTRYEIARILGARALQIAMDAPLLLKMSEDELEDLKYDALKISEKEFNSGVLPITVRRPLPTKKDEKLTAIKEEKIDDKKIIAKEKEIEEEIVEKAKEMGFATEDEGDDLKEEFGSEEDKE